MTTPEEEFDTYAAHGEDFNAEDQVAALLTENQVLPELTSRVAECRTTYLTELQVLLMGYHEDFLQIGNQMKDICDVVEDLKTATRRGRTAIGDVSAWSLPQNNNNSSSFGGGGGEDFTGGSTFALGDPWEEEQEASEQFNHHHNFANSNNNTSGSNNQKDIQSSSSGAAALVNNNNKLNQVILPIVYLATLARSNETRNPTQDAIGQAASLITSAQKTERLLHCALEQVQRRIISNRQVFGLKEVDEIAQGANQEVGLRADPAPSALSMLRSGVLDSFEEESWSRHPLGIGDLEPRWSILSNVGRTIASSSLLLRTHTALINDFSTSLVQSSVDIRMATLRFSTVLSAILEHAAVQREEVIMNKNSNQNNNTNNNNNQPNEDDDPAALTAWAMREITRAATDIFAPFIERRKHVAPNADAANSSKAFQSSTLVAAADSIAMDIALASNFLAISLPHHSSNNNNNISSAFFPSSTSFSSFSSSSSSSTNFLGPLTFSLLRTTQPNQLNFFWDQVKSAISSDFNFASAETASFLLSTTLSSTFYEFSSPEEQQQYLQEQQQLMMNNNTNGEKYYTALMKELCGCEQLPRQSLIRSISPFLSGVQQHKGLSGFFKSDEWLDFCSESRLVPAATLKQLSDILLASYVSEASRKLWDHFMNVLSVKSLVAEQLHELNEQMTNHSSTAGSNNNNNNGGGTGDEQQLLLIDFYFSHPDWEAQIDLALSHILSSFTTSLVGEYTELMNSTARSVIMVELENKVAEAEAQQMQATSFANPPVISCFRPHLFISSFDISVASALSVVAPAATVAGLMLQERIDRDDDGSVNNSNLNGGSVVNTKCSRVCQKKILTFIVNSVFCRSGSSYSPAFSLSVNELRLRLDGGGSLQNFGEDYENVLMTATNDVDSSSARNKVMAKAVAERAATFLLLPYTNSNKGDGEVSLLTLMTNDKVASDLFTCLLTHKLVQMLSHCQKVGGPMTVALYAAGLAMFVCDESTLSSKECWNILFQTRAPFMKKILVSSGSTDSSSSTFSSAGVSILLKSIAASLFILSPALEVASEVCFPDLFSSSPSSKKNNIYDDCIKKVQKMLDDANKDSSSSTTTIYPSASMSSSFESVLSSTIRESQTSFAIGGGTTTLPDCCWKNLNELKQQVQDLVTISTGRR